MDGGKLEVCSARAIEYFQLSSAGGAWEGVGLSLWAWSQKATRRFGALAVAAVGKSNAMTVDSDATGSTRVLDCGVPPQSSVPIGRPKHGFCFQCPQGRGDSSPAIRTNNIGSLQATAPKGAPSIHHGFVASQSCLNSAQDLIGAYFG